MSLFSIMLRIPAILIALTVHEYAHAKVAWVMGDPTARLRGRMTLNPLSHIDPMGFLCLILAGFGWAKPVPINPFYFSDPRKGMMWSSFAGPVANFLAACAMGLVFRLLGQVEGLLAQLLALSMFYNVTLALFNLLPLPPLDGSHVLKGLLPRDLALKLYKYDRVLMMVLFGAILADSLLHSRILGGIVMGPALEIFSFIGGKEAVWALIRVFRAA